MHTMLIFDKGYNVYSIEKLYFELVKPETSTTIHHAECLQIMKHLGYNDHEAIQKAIKNLPGKEIDDENFKILIDNMKHCQG